MFAWLRERVRLAILAGWADALAEIDSDEAHLEALEAVRALQDRVRLSLPAPDTTEADAPARTRKGASRG